jgi:hypothetical protein
MPITLITGPANAGKAQVVMDAVRRDLAHGEEPLLVVPTRADVDHYRRELAGEGAVMGVRVERFDGLLGEAVRRVGMPTPPVLGGLARERLLAAIVERHRAPEGIDGDAARSEQERASGAGGGQPSRRPRATPGYVRALGAFFAEVRVRRVTPGGLGAAMRRWAADGGGSADAHVEGLFEAYDRALEGIGRVDEEQRALRALDALRRKPALWGGTPVLFYGFDDLTRLQIDAIETLGKVVGALVTVSLAYEPGRAAFAGRAGSFHALEPLSCKRIELGARAEYYAPGARAALGHLERSLFEPDAPPADPRGAVRLLEGGGRRAELELVASEVGRLLAEGMAPEDIAVVLRAPAAADLVEEVFSAAGIPHAMRRRRRFADTATGGALLGLLRCVPGSDGVAPGRASDLLAWLRAPGLLEHPELADRLEARAKRVGAESAERARALWEETHWRLDAIDRLDPAAADRGSSETSRPGAGAGALIDRAARELRWLFDAPRRGGAGVLEGGELDEAHALRVGLRALGELRELARLEPELAPADAAELAKLLEGVTFVSGERPAPGRVAVLDPLALRARRVRALFLCGLQDGVFPAPARPQLLLAVPGSEDALAAERYLLYAAVSRPEELLVLSWHAASEDGTPVARSPFVDDVCDLFDERLFERRRCRPLGAVGWSAPGDRPPLRTGAAEETLEPLREGNLLEGLSRSGDASTGEGARGYVWSASSLGRWIACPVAWFVEKVLAGEDLDPTAEPLARGGLAHAVLKDTLEGLKRRTGSARLTPESLPLARELLAGALSEKAADFPLSTAPERRVGMRRRLEADLERYLAHAAEGAADRARQAAGSGARVVGLEPSHLELGFGFADEEGGGLGAFDLGGGVMLRGRIDRVDVGEDGEAVVYDYKGSSAPPVARWVGEGNLQVALYMRVVEGLLGLRAVGGFYQPLTGADLRARGVLDGDSGVDVECLRTDRRDHDEVRALLEEATAAARQAAAQAARGELRARPETCAFNGGCSYPTICRCGR